MFFENDDDHGRFLTHFFIIIIFENLTWCFISFHFRGHKVLTYLVGPDEQTSVAYKLWNKTAEKSMHNASCGTTVVKIDVHYAPSFTIKREPQFGIPIIEGMTVMLGKQMEYFWVMG